MWHIGSKTTGWEQVFLNTWEVSPATCSSYLLFKVQAAMWSSKSSGGWGCKERQGFHTGPLPGPMVNCICRPFGFWSKTLLTLLLLSDSPWSDTVSGQIWKENIDHQVILALVTLLCTGDYYYHFYYLKISCMYTVYTNHNHPSPSSSLNFMPYFLNYIYRTGQVASWLKALTALRGDWSLIPTPVLGGLEPPIILVLEHLTLSSGFHGHRSTCGIYSLLHTQNL